MSDIALSKLLTELPETTRNSTTGALDNLKRTRAINRILQDLQDYGDWDWTRRTRKFDYIDGVREYSLQNYIGATCLDNDGLATIGDFKTPHNLRITSETYSPFDFQNIKDVRYNINAGRNINEFGIDNDLIVINFPRQTSSQVHNCDSLTAMGTITASGDAANLTIDEVEFYEGTGALNFDVSAGTAMTILFSGMASLDLTALKNVSHWTVRIDLPTITNFTSVRLRWGNDSSNYWEKTETARADGQSLEAGRNLFAFKWADAGETGTPDAAAVDWAQITITYSASTTDTDFRIDDLRVGKRVKMELDYYSLAMVKTSAGSYQLEFNPDGTEGQSVQTDKLIEGSSSRLTVIRGATHECFEIIGGKSERDRTDSFKKYEISRASLFKKRGHRLRREGRTLSFPGVRGRGIGN